MMKLTILFLFFFSHPLAKAQSGPRPLWFNCQHDQDCLYLEYPCVEAVINRTFQKEARSYYQHKSLSIDCPQGPMNQQIETSCEKNKCQIKRPEWFQCERDLECIHIKYDCAEAVINMRFEAEARKFYEHKAQVLNCIVPLKKGKEPPRKVLCKDKKCALEAEKKETTSSF